MRASRIFKIFLWVSIIAISLVILGPILFYIILWSSSTVTQGVCYPKFAMAHEIKPSWSEITNYIENSPRPGMNRVEVRQTLDRLGKVTYVLEGNTLVNGRYRDQIGLKLCPEYIITQEFLLFAYYSLDGKFLFLDIEEF